jgi:hypothetical protein
MFARIETLPLRRAILKADELGNRLSVSSNDQDTLGCQGSFRFGPSLAQVTDWLSITRLNSDPDGLLNRSD